jgi:ABC-type uncharacterized transport system YnjBCD ATPase subunit
MTEMLLGKDVTWMMFMSFFIMGTIGLIASVLFDVYSSGIKTNDFDFGKFWTRNKFRIYLSFLAIVIGILFSEQLLGSQLNNWTAFLSGFMSDKLIENLLKRKRKTSNEETV